MVDTPNVVRTYIFATQDDEGRKKLEFRLGSRNPISLVKRIVQDLGPSDTSQTSRRLQGFTVGKPIDQKNLTGSIEFSRPHETGASKDNVELAKFQRFRRRNTIFASERSIISTVRSLNDSASKS